MDMAFYKNVRKSMLGKRTQHQRPALQLHEISSSELPTACNVSLTVVNFGSECTKKAPLLALNDESEDHDLPQPPTPGHVVRSLFSDDSFEKNETMCMNASHMDTAISSSVPPAKSKQRSNKSYSLVNSSLLKTNSAEIKQSLRERKMLKKMKRELLQRYKLVDMYTCNEFFKTPSKKEIFKKYHITPDVARVRSRIQVIGDL